MSIRILIADDHGVLRAGLRALLKNEPNFQVVGEAADGEETLRLAQELRPDIVLLDITMPGLSGIQVTRALQNGVSETRVLILTLHEDIGLLREAIDAGARGYIIKRAVDSELTNAINTVWRGQLYVHPLLTQALLKSPLPVAPPDTNADVPLTRREIQILQLIVQGYTNRQIAEMLTLSVRTVDSHRASVMGKLGLRTRVELVRYATEHGLTKPL
jgi:DNA-binding NarL/FixJ family response regulator